tara:strand:+ start:582 stop:965 length:384 start_codon:yes stop_codon:yes gene_type:complete
MQTKELKVMVLGPNCGKTTFVKSINNIDYNYSNSTLGCEVTPYELYTNNGKRRIIFWEVGSQYQGLKDKYCIDTSFAIIFKNNSDDHLEFENWLSYNIPRIYVENYNILDNEYIIQNIKNTIVENLL